MWKIMLVMLALVSPKEPPKQLAVGLVKSDFPTEVACDKGMTEKSFVEARHQMASEISKKLNNTNVIITAGCVDTSKVVAPEPEPKGESF